MTRGKVCLIWTSVYRFVFSTKRLWPSLKLPYEAITCNDIDLSWMNEQIKTLIAGKSALYKRVKWRMLNSKLLDALQANLQTSISFIQFQYYNEISTKLSHPSTSPKCCWTLLQTVLNARKIPFIPPFFHDSKFIADFKEKSEIFRSFFAKQCS